MKARYSFLKRFNFDTLYNTFLGLNPREQIFALIGAGAALLLVVGLPLLLASSKLSGLEEQIREGNEKRMEIGRRMEQYQQLRKKLGEMESRVEQGFDATVSSSLTGLATEAGLGERIQNIRERGATPSELFDEISVEVKLTKVTLPQLIDYLYKIEKDPKRILRVTEMRIKRRFDDKRLFDVEFQASTYRLQQAGG
ncbi:MAG: hypothetical protein HY609_07070 [Deltaproteobacteria bacterium]|nr:hypothetical protein [Deltaproteobacteria bacterium]MBI4224681.1 hypothetical protein [Deltaproteobacteria bacterium]